MRGYRVRGGIPLCGTVKISGTKNAALAILFATILVKGDCVIENLPLISDIFNTLQVLREMGAEVEWLDESTVRVCTDYMREGGIPYEILSKMRASCYMLGAMTGRFGKVEIPYPGGCNFGTRPVDQHLKGLEHMGCVCGERDGFLFARTFGLRGTDVNFDVVSVGATVNLLLAAVTAVGVTRIHPVAKEPHVCQLAEFLNLCGGKIYGIGSDVLEIHGVSTLCGCRYRIAPDMIETGTYLIAAAATGGEILCADAEPKHLISLCKILEEMGVEVRCGKDWIAAKSMEKLKAVSVETAPYPGFATDLHPPLAVLLSMTEMESKIRETVWARRFQYLEELKKMGVSVEICGDVAVFHKSNLHSAQVYARDLRGGAAVLIAALATVGTTDILGIDPIERGYDSPVEKLKSLGGNVEKVDFDLS